MCTSIFLFRQYHKWPVIIGSNRDENLNRLSKFPGRHWKKKYPHVVAGKDEEKQGSWIGINDFGLVVIIHNRIINSKNIHFNNSRGNIVLEVLNNSTIEGAMQYISNFDRLNYNSFNLLIASKNECYWVKHDLDNTNIITKKIRNGLSIITDKDLNDRNDKKINYYFKLFSSLQVPNPTKDNWQIWIENLTNSKSDTLIDSEKICFMKYSNNYGTRSSSLIAIPNAKNSNEKIVFKSTDSFPTKNNYINVVI